MQDLFRLIDHSIEDQYLSRSEKKAIKNKLTEAQLDNESLIQLRTYVFNVARNNINHENYNHIISWLETTFNAITSHKRQMSSAYFSPGNKCRNVIIDHISNATRIVKICVFTISDDRISQAILDKHHSGTEIQIITDNDKLHDRGSDITQLSENGIKVRIDNTSNHMHHKFALIDDEVLITGSYNWTRSAAKYNHENIVVLKEEHVVNRYIQEFNNLWPEMSLYN